MKKQLLNHGILSTLLMLLISIQYGYSQLSSVYMVSPKWMIGKTSGMNFVSGTNTIIDPVNLGGNPASNANQEATSTICDPGKNIAFYCNNFQTYGVTNALFTSVNLAGGGYSSTQGCVTFPDPATAGDYYLFSGNDITGGTMAGINWYRIRKAGAVYTVLSGPNNLATSGQVSEGLSVSSDGAAGYWVVGHTQGFPNEYWSWHVTAAGVILPKVVSASSSRGGSGAGGTIRFNKCQNRIALIGSQEIEVYNWDKSSGSTSGVIRFSGTGSGPAQGYSGDFSPNGNVLYFSGLNAPLLQWDLGQTYAAGVVTVTGSAVAGGIQLGPNNKIYVSTAGTGVTTTTVGVVNTPNVVGAGACGYVNAGLTLTGTGVAIGLANISWLNPQLLIPRIDTVRVDCSEKDFSIAFTNYFGDEIDKQTATVHWDWGHGGQVTNGDIAPSHTFPTTGGPYTVTLSFQDIDGCQTWTNTKTVPIACSAPVKLLDFVGVYNQGNVDLQWQTATEVNNDYFELQKSLDGINFTTISNVRGAGNSSSLLNYKHTDVGVSGTILYYRLVQHDFDGATTASKIISIRIDKTGASPIVIMPNPFSSSFTITKMYPEAATVLVYDVLGRLLEHKSTTVGELSIMLGESLASGTYIVQYLSGSTSYAVRVEKQ